MGSVSAIFVDDETGDAVYVYDDDVDRVFRDAGFKGVIRRASYVEPTEDGWVADLSPAGGPKLGPREDRATVLDLEKRWLVAHLLDIPADFFEEVA